MTMHRIHRPQSPLANVPALCAAAAVVLLAVVALFAAAPATAAERPAERWEEIEYPPLPEQEVPQPRRVELDNGMVVMLLEDHELPLVNATALVRTGSRLEPADKVGLAGLTGTVLRTGGSESMPADELDRWLADRAASIETSIGTTTGSASMDSLTADYPEVLRALADLLRNPALPQEKLDLAKTQLNSSISRQNDNPQGITFREFSQVIYGEDSPYARDETYETVANVSRDDLVAWHGKYFHPNRIILGLVGDFDSEEALAHVREAFGDWPAGPPVEPGEAQVAYREEPAPGVFYVEKDDMTQSNILIGHLGIVRDNPDYYAVEVMNNVLGGGFASRLFSNVRSAKGLAYAVFGQVGSNYDYPGVTQLFTTTKTSTTGAAIEALIEEAEGMTAEPPDAEEVAKAKDSILNSFVFSSDSTREILGQQLRYEYFGYPLDWLDRYREGIEAVTVEQVLEAAEKYIHPDRFSILVVGPSEGMDKPLSTYGEVSELDITIPQPAAERAEVTEEGRAQAGELLDRAVEAAGGAGVVDALHALAVRGNASQQTPMGEMEVGVASLRVFPDRFRQEITLPMGSIRTVLSAGTGFAVTPQGVMDLPASRLAALEKALHRDPLTVLRMRNDPALEATVLPPGELDGTPLDRLQVAIEGEVMVVGLDPDSGHIRQVSFQDSGPDGSPGETVRTFSDYRTVDGGLTYPFAMVGTFDGETVTTLQVESVEVDPEVEEGAFERPE